MEIFLGIVGLIIAGVLADFITAHWWAALIVGGGVFMYFMHPTLSGTIALLSTATFIYISPVLLGVLVFYWLCRREA